MAKPLAGVRVLEVAVLFNGDVVGQHLGDLGAEVIKIESATSPDFLRRLTPEPGRPNRSPGS